MRIAFFQGLPLARDTFKVEVLHTSTGNFRWFPAFVAESLERVERGLPTVADLDDLLAAMRLIDAAYASTPFGTVGPGIC